MWLTVLMICVISILCFRLGYTLAKFRYDSFGHLEYFLDFFDENSVTEENIDEFHNKIGILFAIGKGLDKKILTVRRATKFMRETLPIIEKDIEEIKQKKQ